MILCPLCPRRPQTRTIYLPRPPSSSPPTRGPSRTQNLLLLPRNLITLPLPNGRQRRQKVEREKVMGLIPRYRNVRL